ncbi:MAG: hypothetical protein ACR2IE_15770 [Candidatus Sumerlaeaceae bacterium]
MQLDHSRSATPGFLGSCGTGRTSGRSSSGSYQLLSTRYGRKLCGGTGYRFRKSWRDRAATSAVMLLRVAVLLGLGLAVPAQAHGSSGCDYLPHFSTTF